MQNYREHMVRNAGPRDGWSIMQEIANMIASHNRFDDEEMEDVRRSFGRFRDNGFARFRAGEYPWEDYMDEARARYRGQPRTSSGRFKRVRYSHDEDCRKEDIGEALAEMFGYDYLVEKAIKEASELVTAAAQGKNYEMTKEFSELCIIMKGLASLMPEEVEEEACEEAADYYEKKLKGHDRHGENPLHEHYRRNYR